MNAKVENNSPSAANDIVRYVLAVLLVIAGIAGFYWFADWATPLRALLPLAGLIAGAAVFVTTPRGRATLEYMSEARFELRKVIWPTRQETIRTTIVILIVVVLVSILLGIMDFFLAGGVRLLL